MGSAEWKIVCAAIAVLGALVGLYLALDGLVSDTWVRFRYGMATLIASVTCFVFLLNCGPGDHG